MTEGSKKSLRARRPPGYLVNDSEEGVHLGYARTQNSKDYVSPAQELNAMGKLLARFVNSTNKYLQEKMKNDDEEDQPAPLNMPSIPDRILKRPQNTIEESRKKPIIRYEKKEDLQRANRNFCHGKDQSFSSGFSRNPIKQNNGLNKDRMATKAEKPQNNQGQSINSQYMNLFSQFSQQANGIEDKMFPQRHVRNHMEAANRAILQQQMLLNSSPFFRENFTLPQQLLARQNHKLFKRSAFHVAIAYYIHLKQINSSHKDGASQINLDPTYPAKKLKGQQDKPLIQELLHN